MPPFLAVTWTIILIAATVILGGFPSLSLFSIAFTILLAWKLDDVKPVLLAGKFTLPFALPLAVVHGILNPAFPISLLVGDFIPLRFDGLTFSLVVTLRIFILSMIVMAWRAVNPDRLIREAVYARLPLSLVVMIAVAASHIQLLTSKIQLVYLAQQARGVPVGPSLVKRARALPRIVIPVIASTISEGAARGLIMVNRGLGTTRFTAKQIARPVTATDVVWAIVGVGALVSTWMLN